MSPTTRSRAWVNRWVFAPTRRRRSFWQRLSPPQLLVGSFLLLVALGTVGLKELPGIYPEGVEPLSWLDALFTATSAVCVTGLIVVDTATYFTTAGQAFILLLIQLGGLGIITFTTLIMAALGRRLSLRTESLEGRALAGRLVGGNLKTALSHPERQLILEALDANGWNRQETARMLGINRTTLYKKMKRFDISYDRHIEV